MKKLFVSLFVATLGLIPSLSMADLYSGDNVLLMSTDGTFQATELQLRTALEELGWSDENIKQLRALTPAERTPFIINNNLKSGEPKKSLDTILDSDLSNPN